VGSLSRTAFAGRETHPQDSAYYAPGEGDTLASVSAGPRGLFGSARISANAGVVQRRRRCWERAPRGGREELLAHLRPALGDIRGALEQVSGHGQDAHLTTETTEFDEGRTYRPLREQ